MSDFVFGSKSKRKLSGVHPDLVAIMNKALELTTIDFMITEGLRTKERQAYLVKHGASHTLRSRHITGHAVDVAALIDGKVRWDWMLYSKIANAVKQAAKDLNLKVEWGGDWPHFKDGCHFQLPWRQYP